MARYRGAVCRQCRREGLKLFLKGDRCYSDKCAFARRAYPPGQHGQARVRKVSDYAVQLREKQKVRRMYGMLEGQFRKYFQLADRGKGVTGENLLLMLEQRLDSVVFRLGFANSRSQARQFIRHNHVQVNGKRVNIPSFIVKVGDEVTIREKSRKMEAINDSMEATARRGVPSWFDLDAKNYKGVLKSQPVREEMTMPIQEQLIVELYSK